MPEGHLAGVSGEEVQPQRHQHVDEEAGHHVNDVVVGKIRKGQQRDHDRGQEQDLEWSNLIDQTFLVGVAPNRPLGLTTRTRINRMYVETCLIPALKK